MPSTRKIPRLWREAAAVTLLTFVLFHGVIKASRDRHDWIDLDIYRGAAALLAQGVNPYDPSDQPEARAALLARFPSFESMEQLEYFVSANLPLSTLYWTGILQVFGDRATAFRLVFAAADAALAGLVVLLLGLRVPWLAPFGAYGRIVLALALVSLSPVLLRWGVYLPEDKGPQILLMAATMLLVSSPRRSVSRVAGPVVFGLAIAYKGLGIFLLPWVVARLLAPLPPERRDLRSCAAALAAPAALTAVAAGVWFLPFVPEVLTMIASRLEHNGFTSPNHSSIWVPVALQLGEGWRFARLAAIALLWGLAFVGIRRRVVGAAYASALLMLAFAVVFLVAGSLDRQNVALVSYVLLLAVEGKRRSALTLAAYYYALGWPMIWVMAGLGELADALFVLGFVVLAMGRLAMDIRVREA